MRVLVSLEVYPFSLRWPNIFSDSANPLYNATRYNDKIIYNDKLTGTKLSHKR